VILEDGCAYRKTNFHGRLLMFGNTVGRAGPVRGVNAGMVPNWPGLCVNGSGLKASVSAACSLGGCLALQATLPMLGI
jgi:hypothetical protein